MKAKENTVSIEKFNQMPIIDRLEALTEKARNSKLEPELFIGNAALIRSLSDSLNLTLCQTVLLCPFFDDAFSCKDRSDLMNFFGCKASGIIRCLPDIEALAMAGYIEHQRRGKSYILSDEAQEAFSDNKGLKKNTFDGLDNISFMNALNQAYADKHEGRSCKNILIKKVLGLIKGNQHLTIAQNIAKHEFSEQDTIIMGLFLSRRIALKEDDLCIHWLRNIFDDDLADITKSFQSGTCTLIKMGYIERIVQGKGKGHYKLTDKAINEFLQEYSEDLKADNNEDDDFDDPFSDDDEKSKAQSSMILPSSIIAKEMFYGAEDQKGIDTVKHLLCEEQFEKIVKRLEERKCARDYAVFSTARLALARQKPCSKLPKPPTARL